MAFENLDDANLEEDEVAGPPPEESNNRTFLIVAGILAGIMLLALIGTAIYAFVLLPQNRNQRATQAAQVAAQNTAVSLGLTQTASAKRWTATSLPATPTQAATKTPVVVAAEATRTPTPILDAAATTQAAFYTQVAAAQTTQAAGATALPTSGFADEVGVPGLLALGAVFVVVIFLVRRLRTTT